MEYASLGWDFDVYPQPSGIAFYTLYNIHWYLLGGRFSPREFQFVAEFLCIFMVYSPGTILIPCSAIVIHIHWLAELKRRELEGIQKGLDFDEARRIEFVQEMASYKDWYDNDPSNWWRRLRDQILIDPYWNWIDPIIRPIARIINTYLLHPLYNALEYLFIGFSKLIYLIYELISNTIVTVAKMFWNIFLQPVSSFIYNLDYLFIFNTTFCFVLFVLFLYLWSIRKLLIVRILILLFFLYKVITLFLISQFW